MNCQIVDQEFRDFENGIVKLINKEELTISEKITMKPFQSDTVYMSSSVGDFAEEVLKGKEQKIENSDFNKIRIARTETVIWCKAI